jgi:uncharacterized protein (UPF0303 family)
MNTFSELIELNTLTLEVEGDVDEGYLTVESIRIDAVLHDTTWYRIVSPTCTIDNPTWLRTDQRIIDGLNSFFTALYQENKGFRADVDAALEYKRLAA